ncbi:hypothetical protein HHI36_011788, partial [Cryptolaemus montrouzieri]
HSVKIVLDDEILLSNGGFPQPNNDDGKGLRYVIDQTNKPMLVTYSSIRLFWYCYEDRAHRVFGDFTFIVYVPLVEGPTFNITKVNRLHMGPYLCIASNGVPPSVSKRIMLIVH